MKREALAEGKDLIDLGVGDPDLATTPAAVDALGVAIRKREHQFYPPYSGTGSFRKAVADWYARRSHVSLDPASQVIGLIGSKEGLAHLALAFVNPGDVVISTDPAYPVLANAALLAGGTVHRLPMTRTNDWLPDLSSIPKCVAERAAIIYVNYPNNPTTALAPVEFLRDLVAFARKYDILIAYDHAYSELVFEPWRSPSILEVEGAVEVALEFNSLSKMFNATGWRVAWAAGCKAGVAGLARVKTNMDSGQFMALQEAGAYALTELWPSVTLANSEIYRRRAVSFVERLQSAGWKVDMPRATFYVWAEVPGSSIAAASRILKEASVVCIPGVGTGAAGEGYLRFALNAEDGRVIEAAERIARLGRFA